MDGIRTHHSNIELTPVTFLTHISHHVLCNLRIKMRAQLKILRWRTMIAKRQDKLKHFENKLDSNISLQRATFSKCFNLSCLVAIMVLHLKVLSWALIFILRLRFPSGKSIATMFYVNFHRLFASHFKIKDG